MRGLEHRGDPFSGRLDSSIHDLAALAEDSHLTFLFCGGGWHHPHGRSSRLRLKNAF
jgi:hypothetical protein